MVACVLSTGCSFRQWARNGYKVGPNYRKPIAPVAENWIDSDDPRVLSEPPKYPDWWSVFQDPVLDGLVESAYQQNLSLREAGQRVLQARAQRAIAVGGLFPQSQALEGSYTRAQISEVKQPFLEPVPGLFSRNFDAWSLGGNLSWEPDIWGRFRRAVEAADANLDASVEEYDAILVCLIAEVVTAYVDLRTFEQRLAYARRNVQIQEQSQELTTTRADEGKTGFISVHLAESNLDATRAAIPELEIGFRQANNRLCTLLGMPPMDLQITLEAAGGIPDAPAEVVVGIPADLLRRRPDVRAAERQVAAQSAEIGIAIADFYPSIAINGKISTQAEDFSNLFSSLSNGGSIGPSFSWNVLNYGRIANNVRFQNARFQELAVNYQNTVLKANQEVEDALVSFLRTQEQVTSLASSVEATQRALELSLVNFKEGESDFAGVFVLQGDLAQKQDRLAAAQGNVVTSLISVYKALGGGWQIRCPNFQPHEITEFDFDSQAEEIPLPDLPTEETFPELIPVIIN
ncbi:efflux transporter outer membrane subunit [Novipirellula herctigrandis]